MSPSPYRTFADRRLDEMLADLKAFVDVQSPTTVRRAAVAPRTALFARLLAEL
ncbi:MAG: hypothetical protein ACYDAB_08135 [bacterium]